MTDIFANAADIDDVVANAVSMNEVVANGISVWSRFTINIIGLTNSTSSGAGNQTTGWTLHSDGQIGRTTPFPPFQWGEPYIVGIGAGYEFFYTADQTMLATSSVPNVWHPLSSPVIVRQDSNTHGGFTNITWSIRKASSQVEVAAGSFFISVENEN